MKKNINNTLNIFFCLFTLVSFGQNGLNNGNLFILLKDSLTISVNEYKNNKINELNSYSITNKSIYTTDQKENVVILNIETKKINIYKIKSNEKLELIIHYKLIPKSLLMKKDNIFIGGDYEKEMLVQYHIKSKKWYNLDIPDEIRFIGKAVDEIVINEKYLIAIDDIVLPKYVLFYYINSNDKLKFSHSKELSYNSTYERIHKARISEKYLGLISTTMNHGYIQEHITLYSDLELNKCFSISFDYRKINNLNDILIINENLYISKKTKGLGIVKLKNNYFKGSNYAGIHSKLKENSINYKKNSKGEIIKLTKIPNTLKIILSIKNSSGEILQEIISQ